MGVFARPKARAVDRRQALRSIPVLNDTVTLSSDEDGQCVVHVSIARGPTFFDRFRPPVIEKRHVFDDLGAFLVQQINGQRTVEELIDIFAAQYQVDPRDAELSTVAFIKMLLQRKILTVVQGDS